MPAKVFKLVHQQSRQGAAQFILNTAPDGYVVLVKKPMRNLEQNSLMWVLLEAFSQQLLWPVNGAMVKLEPEEWKDILSAAYRQESQRVAMGLSGGMVMLGMRTSKMNKAEFAEFMEFIMATAADRGVKLEREAVEA